LNELSTNTDYLYVRGLALYYDGQTENAKKIWKHLLQRDPDDQRCKEAIKKMNRQEEAKEKGNTAFKEGDYETAEKYYTEGINQDPKNKNLVSQLYLNRSTVKLKSKKPKEALEDCNLAIQLNEYYAKAFLRKGEILMQLEKYDEAKQEFTQAHQLDPSLGARAKVQEAEKQAKMAARKDYYKILEVEKTANDDEIKKAYKKQALKWHPDKNGGDEETRLAAEVKFKDINEAYSVLSDSKKKQRYDSGADLDEMGGFDGGMDPNTIFRTFFGGGGGDFGGFGGGGHSHSRNGGGFPGGFSFSYSFN
jgi:DnaJ family protein C protein 7